MLKEIEVEEREGERVKGGKIGVGRERKMRDRLSAEVFEVRVCRDFWFFKFRFFCGKGEVVFYFRFLGFRLWV